MLRSFRPLAACLVVAAGAAVAQEPSTAAIRFNRDVRPILSDNCLPCHGPDRAHREADLRLDRREDALEVLHPGSPAESELWRRVSHADPSERMPPADAGDPLDAEELDVLRRWIEAGAPYERHWAYAPLAEVPDGDAADAIDRRIDAALAERGLHAVGDADPVTLARRIWLDLTGLPPTPAQVDAFVAADPGDRVERLVDRLLQTDHFAERMAVWWLDLVRYADTVGYHGDQEHQSALYRDYVLKAFRDNYPFDRFTVEQLAGDLLPERTDEQWIASCYNRLLQTTHEGGLQPGEYLAKYMADRVRNVSEVWLGATVGCAECHDHKYDPYTQRDFYRLGAFFADVDEEQMWRAPNSTPTKRLPEAEVLGPFEQERLAAAEDELARAREHGADAAEIERLIAVRDALATAKRKVMVTVAKEPRTVRVLARGNWMDDSGEVVSPGIPAELGELAVEGRATRLDLARWLTSAANPVTPRVVVNRLWALFFGRGLSHTLADNGSQGAPPSHPEILDLLARDFASDWDLRRVVRRIVTSRTYRRSSVPTPDLVAADPTNVWLARQGRWRLPAEFVRDTFLAVSGLLVDRLGGTSARPYQPPGYYANLNFPPRKYHPDTDDGQYRRGVYVHWQRMFLHPMLKAFDAPTREECTAQRSRSNTPLQALALLNDPSAVEAARVFAARVMHERPGDDAARARRAFRLVVARTPDARDVATLVDLVAQHRAEYAADPAAARALLGVGMAEMPDDVDVVELAAWTSCARALLNLGETYTRS